MAPDKELCLFNFSLVVSTVCFYLDFHLLRTKLHTDLKSMSPISAIQNSCLILLFSTFLSSFGFFLDLFRLFFFQFVTNIFLKKRSRKAKSITNFAWHFNHEFCMALIGRLGISRCLCNPIFLLETENISKHYDHNRERDKFAYLTMQTFCALCIFHRCTFL